MAKYTFEQAVKVIDSIDELNEQYAIKLCKEYNLKQLKEKFEMAERNIYIPQPNENGIIPQFDGYFDLEDVSVNTVRSRLLDPKEYWGGANGVAAHTQVIKQADVVTWLTMFPDDVSDEIKLKTGSIMSKNRTWFFIERMYVRFISLQMWNERKGLSVVYEISFSRFE